MFPDTMYGAATTQTRLQSETADNVLWGRYATPPIPDPSLSRISFDTVHSPLPVHTLVDHVGVTRVRYAKSRARFLVVCGRSRRLAVENHHAELKSIMEEHGNADVAGELRKTVGDVAAAIVLSQCEANVAVVQT